MNGVVAEIGIPIVGLLMIYFVSLQRGILGKLLAILLLVSDFCLFFLYIVTGLSMAEDYSVQTANLNTYILWILIAINIVILIMFIRGIILKK